MSQRFTISHLDHLLQQGKIRGYKVSGAVKNDEPKVGGRKIAKHFTKRGNANKNWMAATLLAWCQQKGHLLEEEYKFHPERKWRFDWAIPEIKTALEYDGGILNPKSAHRAVSAINRDIEKINAAQQLGWKVLRFTAITYQTVIIELERI